MVQNKTGSIDLSKPSGRPRVIRSKETIEKIQNRFKCNKRVSSRKLAKQFDISERSVGWILKGDFELRPYKKQTEPLLTKTHQIKRVLFANWICRIIFEKDQTQCEFCFPMKRCLISMFIK